MTPEVVAVVLIVVVHLIGAGMLVWVLVAEDEADWRSWRPDDGPGGGGPKRPDGPAGPPLPDADQSPRGGLAASPRPRSAVERAPRSADAPRAELKLGLESVEGVSAARLSGPRRPRRGCRSGRR